MICSKMYNVRIIKVLALSGSLTVLSMDLVNANTGFENSFQEARSAVAVNFTDADISDAYKLANYAYHTYDEQSSNTTKRKRFQDDLLNLKDDGYTDVKVLKGVTGNVLYKTESNLGIAALRGDTLHVAFRGTKFNSLADIFTDLNVWRKDFNGLGYAHSGFSEAYKSIEKELSDFLMPLVQTGKVKKINFEGHSLGAALAHLAAINTAAKLNNQAVIKLTTFDEPRAGNHDLARLSDKLLQKENHVRITNGRDPFGASANLGIFGNKHSGQEVRLNAKEYNPAAQHSLDKLRVSPEAVAKHNANPTKIDGIRTTVSKSIAAAKSWVQEKSKAAKEAFVSGFQSARKKVVSWFGF